MLRGGGTVQDRDYDDGDDDEVGNVTNMVDEVFKDKKNSKGV